MPNVSETDTAHGCFRTHDSLEGGSDPHFISRTNGCGDEASDVAFERSQQDPSKIVDVLKLRFLCQIKVWIKAKVKHARILDLSTYRQLTVQIQNTAEPRNETLSTYILLKMWGRYLLFEHKLHLHYLQDSFCPPGDISIVALKPFGVWILNYRTFWLARLEVNFNKIRPAEAV